VLLDNLPHWSRIHYGDLDGDFDIDLVVSPVLGSFADQDEVTLLTQEGPGSFVATTLIPEGTGPGEYRVVDLNGDGRLDVVSKLDQQRVVWFQNAGDGSFAPNGPVSGVDFHMALADFNNDGRLDVVSVDLANLYLYRQQPVALTIEVAERVMSETSASAGTVTIRRQGSVESEMTALLQLGGTATTGVDYQPVNLQPLANGTYQIGLPVGVAETTIEFLPLADDLTESNESIEIQLLANPLDHYRVLEPSLATVLIVESTEFDYGDAPLPFSTTRDGLLEPAGHRATGPKLGTLRDVEEDGIPGPNADGDDVSFSSDEDGVAIPVLFAGTSNAVIQVVVTDVTTVAFLDAWVDFNGDGSWSGADERIAAHVPVHNGENEVLITVPASATPGQTYARFRLSTTGVSSHPGIVDDGEVEDYLVQIEARGGVQLADWRVWPLPATQFGSFVELEDLDGNGLIDVLVSSTSGGRDITAHLQTAPGQFTLQPITLPTSPVVSSTLRRWLDFDLDGDLDLVTIAYPNSNQLIWFENFGDYSFAVHSRSLSEQNRISAFEVGDMDGDGDFDIVAEARGRFVWFENSSNTQSVPKWDLGGFGDTNSVASIVPLDWDANGTMDVIASKRKSIRITTFDEEREVTSTSIELGADVLAMQATDLDGDGDLDMLVATTAGIVQLEHQSDHTVSILAITPTSTLSRAYFVQLDADPTFDMIGVPVGVSQLQRLEIVSNVSSSLRETYTITHRSSNALHLADIDGDGDSDVVYSGYVDGYQVLWHPNLNVAVRWDLDESDGNVTAIEGESFDIPIRRTGDLSSTIKLQLQLHSDSLTPSDYQLRGVDVIDQEFAELTIPAGVELVTLQFQKTSDGELQSPDSLTIELLPTEVAVIQGVSTLHVTILDDTAADFGDAPAPYPTLTGDGGAQHGATGPLLGVRRDTETEGHPSADALGDDSDQEVSDEDGVVFSDFFGGQQTGYADVTITNVEGNAYLNAWVDFAADRSWGGAFDRIAANVAVSDGVTRLTFPVPVDAATGTTYARFRISSQPLKTVGGIVADGEVEDYAITIHSPYPATAVFDYPKHVSATINSAAQFVPFDFDRDGATDIVSNGVAGEYLGWYRNEGQAGFTEVSLGTNAIDFAIADLDDDGNYELVAADATALRIYHVLDDQIADDELVADNVKVTQLLAITDWDDDGDLDIAGTLQDNQRVQHFVVWLRLEDGSFSQWTSTLTNISQLVDIDRDGDLDAGRYERTGTFQFSSSGSTIPNGTVYDLDGDGDLDFVRASGNTLSWSENISDEGEFFVGQEHVFALPAVPGNTRPRDPVTVSVGDIDGDSRGEVVLKFRAGSSRKDQGIEWIEITEDQQLEWHPIFTSIAPNWQQFVESVNTKLADMDGDGDLDIVAMATAVGGLEWFENRNVELSLTPATVATVPETLGTPIEYRIARVRGDAREVVATLVVDGRARIGEDYLVTGLTSMGNGQYVATLPEDVDEIMFSIQLLDDAESEVLESIRITPRLDGRVHWSTIESSIVEIVSDEEIALDFGDAPESYRSSILGDDARHVGIGPLLGVVRDVETHVATDPHAEGDDLALSSTAVDDEDGVAELTVSAGLGFGTVTVQVSGASPSAYLDAWIDFNFSGTWEPATERIFTRLPLTDGIHELQFPVPFGIHAGETYARFRISSSGTDLPYGQVDDGEVEDYQLRIGPPAATAGGIWRDWASVAIDMVDIVAVWPIDTDGDMDQDVITLSANRSLVTLHENIQQSDFPPTTLFVTQSPLASLREVDLDLDGDIDFVGHLPEDGSIVWWENRGGNHFEMQHIDGESWGVHDVQLADVDADGRIDVVTADPESGTIAWWKYTTSGEFIRVALPLTLPGVTTASAADFDRDGAIEFIAWSARATALLYLELESPSNWSVRQFASENSANFYQHGGSLVIGDRTGGFEYGSSSQWIVDDYLDIWVMWDAFSEYTLARGINRLQSDNEFDVRNVGDSSDYLIVGIDFNGDGTQDIKDSSLLDYEFTGGDEFRLFRPADLNGNRTVDILAVSADGTRVEWHERVHAWVYMLPHLVSVSEGDATRTSIGRIRSLDSIPHLDAVEVAYRIGGTATLGVDFNLYLGGAVEPIILVDGTSTVTFRSSQTLYIETIGDAIVEGRESITFTVLPGPDVIPVDWASQWVLWLADDEPGDYGNAPHPYPTAADRGGATHGAGGPHLGTAPTYEVVNQEAEISAEELNDGVIISDIHAGQHNATITIDLQDAPNGAVLNGWIDWDRDGNWTAADEHILRNITLMTGTHQLPLVVPTGATPGTTYARFRVSSAGNSGPTGVALDGEVEDYELEILPPRGGAEEFSAYQAWPAMGTDAERIVAVQDLDSDHDMDVVVYVPAYHELAWYETVADYQVMRHSIYIGEAPLDSFRIADLNSDGQWDLAFVSTETDQVIWLASDGQGGFVAQGAIAVSTPSSLRVLDLNQDGAQDLLVTSYLENALVQLIQTSSGVFQSVSPAFGARHPADAQMVDYNRDGEFDYFVLQNDQRSRIFTPQWRSISYYQYRGEVFGSGGETRFIETQDSSGVGNVAMVRLADGDLRLDFMPWLNAMSDVRVNSTVQLSDHSLDIADLDADGDLDLLAVAATGSSIVWYENEGHETFVERVIATPYNQIVDARFADWNRDGRLDLVGYAQNPDTYFVLQGILPGDFDDSGRRDVNDLDALIDALVAGQQNSAFDLTGDGVVDREDLQSWVIDRYGTLWGDANLDFVVDGLDLNRWNAGKFKYDGGWSAGDFNGDGATDVSDWNLWFVNRFRSARGSATEASRAARVPKAALSNVTIESLRDAALS
jgi:hypothetical protein